jgi:hypothetical protein
MPKSLSPLLTARILWTSFALSHFLFAAVFWLTHDSVSAAPLPPGMGWVIAASAVGLVLTAPIAQSRVLGPVLPGGDAAQLAVRRLQAFIVGSALREASCVLAGAVLLFTHDPILWALPAGAAFAMQLVAFPIAEPAAERRPAGR